MKRSLEQALALISPRILPRPAPLPSTLIHLSVVVVWLLLFARAFFLHGVVAWSTGLAYVAYDTLLLGFVTLKTLPLLRPAAPLDPASETRSLPAMGVIVAAHDEAAVLPMTLAALLRQVHGLTQIVIADDGSTDNTRALLTERFGLTPAADGKLSAPSSLYPNLYWLRVPHGGKARALNAAITVMTTDTVMTVDADTLLDDDATYAMRAAFASEPKLVAAAGILVPVCGKSVSGRVFQWFQTYEYMRNFIARFAWMRADSLLLVSGAFAAFRRDALLAVGGFDPQCLVEDYELIHRLRRHSADHGLGWAVRVVGDAHARTDAPGTLGSFLRQRRRWFAGFLQTQYWNRDMTGNPRYGTLGMLMLPVKAIDTMQPIYGLTAFALLPGFLFGGHRAIVVSIFCVIGLKTAIDLAFYLWCIHLYRRWTGERPSSSLWMAMAAALAEPFTFQLIRHTGALLGWLHFLRGGRSWGRQQRSGLVAPDEH
ncbi:MULTISPECIES: glycosyltransferase family 2 protein [unclassified Paraburkholderia]|uniref:glycosyltransferase family 2 protein n=1 Tax=unclassified Paraburkholderia TaxID=2615204 RepID=UPI0016079129|nr:MULTISPECIES: glycosyltransferase family 2 protein [unclassified Paraburkholderia]MBB5411350.1 cellulose synthase/poly-beta-1,6-N-acetylglucosamine synthase-like glycosyltransferase [Paraburkholderia sp. HC6.4b]MBB5449885.1 cellulose synthase/poly-beta-1,6-N-acetylglucosamine synthase-like glycosyltransferase [Paraburkholderia sp. Kb1A]